MEFRTVAAPAGDLHGIVPDRGLEYVRGSPKAILCVLHVTAPSPAARRHSRARQAAINDRGSRPRVPWQHQFEDARGVPSSRASPSPGRIAGHQQWHFCRVGSCSNENIGRTGRQSGFDGPLSGARLIRWSALKTRDSFLLKAVRRVGRSGLFRIGPDMPSRDAYWRCFGERGLNGHSDRPRRRVRMIAPCVDRRSRSAPNASRRSRLRRGRRSREWHTGDGCCARDCARSARAGHHRKAGPRSSARFSPADPARRTNFPNQCR